MAEIGTERPVLEQVDAVRSIEGVDDRRDVGGGPRHGERAARGEDEDDGLARLDESLEETLLGRGQAEARAVAAPIFDPPLRQPMPQRELSANGDRRGWG